MVNSTGNFSTISSQRSSKDKILEFDILRGIAILLLMLHHGGIYNFSVLGFPLSNLSTFNSLFLLGSFVFLSGYLLVTSLEKYSLTTFWISRVWRILIPYWIALVLFLLLLDLEVTATDTLLHFLGGQMLLAPRLTTPILTLWFIGLTLAYYASFGFMVKAVRSIPVFLLAALLLFMSSALIRTEYGLIGRRFFYYFPVFTAGILCAKTGTLDRLTSDRYFLLDKILPAAVGIALLAPFRDQVGEAVNLPLILIISIYILTMILMTLSIARLLVRRGFNFQLFTYLSAASFFAYLFHRPIWDLALLFYWPEPKTSLSVYLILTGLFLVLPLSYLLQTLYNRCVALFQRESPKLETARHGIDR